MKNPRFAIQKLASDTFSTLDILPQKFGIVNFFYKDVEEIRRNTQAKTPTGLKKRQKRYTPRLKVAWIYNLTKQIVYGIIKMS